jgi:hypothetical protein
VPAFGLPLGTAARAMIPSDVQQIICVDYRSMENSPTAMSLKDRVLPENLKNFEKALVGVGITERDLQQLTFASVRAPDHTLRILGVAQGNFTPKKVLARLRAKKIKGDKYRTAMFYPMANGLEMMFADDYSLIFGDHSALESAVNTREGDADSLNSNSEMVDMMSGVEGGAVWSVLDNAGTQNMMRSALGQASGLADYEMVKKHLLGSRYTMDFTSGVNFNLDVLTSDSMTAATLSSLLKAGVMFRKMNASGPEKVALDSVTVDSSNDQLKLHFKTDDSKFQSLLQSDLFKQVSR